MEQTGMEVITSEIKGYVNLIDSTLTDDDLLDFMIEDVIDRALVYTNRIQLIDNYNEEYELFDPLTDDDEMTADGSLAYGRVVCPLPKQIRKGLAITIVNVYRTFDAKTNGANKEVSSVSDNGQSVNYSTNAVTFLQSMEDDKLFSGMIALLDKFKLATVVETTNRF